MGEKQNHALSTKPSTVFLTPTPNALHYFSNDSFLTTDEYWTIYMRLLLSQERGRFLFFFVEMSKSPPTLPPRPRASQLYLGFNTDRCNTKIGKGIYKAGTII